MACAAIVKNAVASSSCKTLDSPPAPLLERIAMPTPADYTEHDACKKSQEEKDLSRQQERQKELSTCTTPQSFPSRE